MRSSSKVDLKNERVAGFSSCELILDLLFMASSVYKQDLESIWIILCVTQNTLRDVINDPAMSAAYINTPELPDHVRLSMSRRAIADKTGLSRETVRRRTNKLIEAKLLEAEPNGNVRLSQDNYDRGSPGSLNQIHASVQAYLKRLDDNGVKMPLPPHHNAFGNE